MLFVCLHYTVRLFYKRFTTISKRMHWQYEIQTIVRLSKLISVLRKIPQTLYWI